MLPFPWAHDRPVRSGGAAAIVGDARPLRSAWITPPPKSP
jgi:hypothetical protein